MGKGESGRVEEVGTRMEVIGRCQQGQQVEKDLAKKSWRLATWEPGLVVYSLDLPRSHCAPWEACWGADWSLTGFYAVLGSISRFPARDDQCRMARRGQMGKNGNRGHK